MNGSANTSEASTPMMTAWCPASLADGSTMLSICIQDILQAGGIWPPDGMKITSGHNANPATSLTKDSSGFLAKVLTASSPDELRRLCDERNKEESLHRMSLMSSPDVIGTLGKKWHPINGLSKETAIQVFRLRTERVELIQWFEKHTSESTMNTWPWIQKTKRFRAVCYELRQLTNIEQYSK
jgi:hypothetical protein